MNEFVQTIGSMPTLFFTVLLGILSMYWVMVIAGALDLDVLDFGTDLDVDGEAPSGVAGLVELLGIGTVPITVVGSVCILASWVSSVAAVEFLSPESILAKAGIFVGASVLGLIASSLVLRPFSGAFEKNRGRDQRSLIGMVGSVTSMAVTDSRGQARLTEGPDEFTVNVRCGGTNDLTHGSKVLVIDHDSQRDVYLVVPAAEALPEGSLVSDRDDLLNP